MICAGVEEPDYSLALLAPDSGNLRQKAGPFGRGMGFLDGNMNKVEETEPHLPYYCIRL